MAVKALFPFFVFIRFICNFEKCKITAHVQKKKHPLLQGR